MALPTTAKMSVSFAEIFILSFLFCSWLADAQQPYATGICGSKTSPSANGYNCNGVEKSCRAYLIFRAQTPYTNLSSIASLLSSDTSQLSKINNASQNATLATNREVIIPITCSCSGQYSQANTTYVVKANDTPYLIAKNTYEGLTTCRAIQNQRNGLTADIFPNERISVPLRCACPTKNQTEAGIKYLLSYIIQPGDAISSIAVRFGADVGRTLEANEKSDQNSVIYPVTTLLVPLQSPPNSSQTRTTVSSPSSQSPTQSSPPPPSSPSHLRKRWDYFGAGVAAGAAFVLVTGSIIFWLIGGKAQKKTKPVPSSESFEAQMKPLVRKSEVELDQLVDLESISSIAKSIKIYSIKELQSATDNFSPNCWIPSSVYRGSINGNQVAIKKTDGDASKEVDLLSKVSHVNLISLVGVCFDDGQWYLVYEFAANGPLSDWIYHEDDEDKVLTWTQRIRIALDVATGLDYLHNFTSPPHVHKDIKSSNILLNSDLRAKISNFGLSKTVGDQEGQFALTKHIVGTRGYMAPEYIENGLVSPGLDVYAFGVLMLEVLTGRAVAVLYGGLNAYLSEVLEAVFLAEGEDTKEKLRGLIDPYLHGNYPAEVAMDMVRLTDSCLRENPGSRPHMNGIVQVLSKTLTTSLIWESTMTNASGSEQLSQVFAESQTR
ncbi:lysM domain receptor-like kinase 4 [Ancistrocladus abbreviatus]